VGFRHHLCKVVLLDSDVAASGAHPVFACVGRAQSEGQRIRSFKIEADGVEIVNGTAVGNKLIGLLPKNYSSSTVVLTITEAAGDPTKPVNIKQFGVIDGSRNRC
jgi:hypothetical protein